MHEPQAEEEIPGMAEVPRLDEDIVRLVRRVLAEQRRPLVQYTSGNGGLLTHALILILMALSAWTLYTVNQLEEEVAVMQCQLSTDCHHAVMRTQP